MNPPQMGHNSNNNNHHHHHHHYQVPHHVCSSTPTPIYAVSNVIHNNCNPNVKNISQVQMNAPLQLQIPVTSATPSLTSGNGSNNTRSGSQASSGYQSQSPVLEGEDKSKCQNIKEEKVICPPVHHAKMSGSAQNKRRPEHIYSNNNNQHIKNVVITNGSSSIDKSLNFSNPAFNRSKCGSQSVDDLSSLGVDHAKDSGYKRRYKDFLKIF